MKRIERIPVTVTVAEKKNFKKLAKSRNTTISEVVRQLLYREADAKTRKR